jgi:nicotinamide-nucleotide amidase
MRVELICIGTELLTGKVNTNIGYIGERLNSIGLDLSLVTTVKDTIDEIEDAFRKAMSRSDIVISTGGLGPTFDDLTREAVAKVLGRTMALNREAFSEMMQFFIKRNWEMSKNNERQAYIIEGAKILKNSLGTAPGQLIEVEKKSAKGKSGNKILILLPGPPREMQHMFEEQAFSYLREYETLIKRKLTLHICGLSESAVDEKIRPIVEAERKLEKEAVEFGILAHQMLIDIKISVSGKDELLIDETLNTLKKEFYDVLGENILGEDKQTLESVTGELLAKSKKTLSLAESCTGGLVAHRITNIPGSSLYFKQGFVTYSNDSKVKVLGVSQEVLQEFGAVSEQTALQMAQGALELAKTDYALSLTGIAGPSGGTPQKPVGLVYIGLAGPNIKEVYKYQLGGNRIEVRERAANIALDVLRRKLVQNAKEAARK